MTDANYISNINILIGPEQKWRMQLLDGRLPPNSVTGQVDATIP